MYRVFNFAGEVGYVLALETSDLTAACAACLPGGSVERVEDGYSTKIYEVPA